jgi:hypothetical protein
MIVRHIVETVETYNDQGVLTDRTITETDEKDDGCTPFYHTSTNDPTGFCRPYTPPDCAKPV